MRLILLAYPLHLSFNSLTDLVRRLFSIFLLCFFGLPLVSPLLAQTPESRLPACCRKGGDHHCMGGMSQQNMTDREVSPNPRLGLQTERCPYTPATVAFHSDLTAPPAIKSYLTSPLSQPLVAARNASMQRIARDRTCPKRGPPQLA